MIKFRGIYNGEFVYGDLLQRPTCRIVNEDGGFEIAADSVRQLVGLDYDGGELYEGDSVICVKYHRLGICTSPIELMASPYKVARLLPCIEDRGTFDKCVGDFAFIDEKTLAQYLWKAEQIRRERERYLTKLKQAQRRR